MICLTNGVHPRSKMFMLKLFCQILEMLLGHYTDTFVTDRTVLDIKNLNNYVYEAKGGNDIYIYHVERVSLRQYS
jgi:hypothetical protein